MNFKDFYILYQIDKLEWYILADKILELGIEKAMKPFEGAVYKQLGDNPLEWRILEIYGKTNS